MITIEYLKSRGLMYVKTGKGKPQEYRATCETVNDYALMYIKKYFSDTIKKLCDERTNVYDHVLYRDGNNRKTEFFLKLKIHVENGLNHSTWQSYLVSCLKNLRDFAPSTNSRYFHNYMERIEMMEAVLGRYSNAKKYYTERSEQKTMNLFDNQAVMYNYVS